VQMMKQQHNLGYASGVFAAQWKADIRILAISSNSHVRALYEGNRGRISTRRIRGLRPAFDKFGGSCRMSLSKLGLTRIPSRMCRTEILGGR
jgi:hypothetical protein